MRFFNFQLLLIFWKLPNCIIFHLFYKLAIFIIFSFSSSSTFSSFFSSFPVEYIISKISNLFIEVTKYFILQVLRSFKSIVVDKIELLSLFVSTIVHRIAIAGILTNTTEREILILNSNDGFQLFSSY